MTTLLLQLAGPLQAWGTGSRFAYRSTDPAPSKSAVIGLLAAAQGRRRTDPIEDLLGLRFGVRVDQPGRVVRDFQTARALDESYSLPLTYRFYLADAAFVVGVEGERGLIESLAAALRRPAFPLFLGRRSCPPARPLLIGVTESALVPALEGVEWKASPWHRRRQPPQVDLDLIVDAESAAHSDETSQDAPLSFDPHHRRFALRGVQRGACTVENPDAPAHRRTPPTGSRGGSPAATSHDPMAMWEAP